MAKKKVIKEPQYLLSEINNPVLNYRVYHMSKGEKLLYGFLSALAGAVVGYVFYGGLFRDSEGLPTPATTIANIVVILVSALIAMRIYLPIRTNQLKNKRQATLRNQFRDLLETLSTAFSSGMNVLEAFTGAHGDLKTQFSEDSWIVQELSEILAGIHNNIPIERLLENLGARSGDEDMASFAEVFDICFREGGDIRDVVRRTHTIMMDKIATEEEIKTKLASNRMQLNVMTVVPIFIVAFLKFSNDSFARNFASTTGVVAITVSLVFFYLAYRWGLKIIDVGG